eukprot:CAMPEP_0198289356 /NCGR_PEP_ID=MMETSP1449-20131203/7562_1 /TAXON_ID=420275 /ORGANISM="Attheya septentrionalis, Strain CCMP2084" /LENGTH=414 /DNA_ID=CAMNT_0043987665 /DNA_START=469 /DNA_END=1713 /DNA_ORIENTATION=+
MQELATQMKQNAGDEVPLSAEEIDMVITSLKNVADASTVVDWDKLAALLKEVAHVSHKNWTRTGENANRLFDILLPGQKPDETSSSSSTSSIEYPSNAPFRTKFERVLHDGNWDGAMDRKKSHPIIDTNNENVDTRPWVVLVTGVNGIRKTTSVYQDWFPALLQEALVTPTTTKATSTTRTTPLDYLPAGKNSFFRQLDHMIAILANEEFKTLYTNAADDNDIDLYARYKDGIFARFRTLSEMLGVILIREAQKESINVMVETSGRDIAMFNYVDEFFSSKDNENDPNDPQSGYRKLALHFTVNDIQFAERSVDKRMSEEVQAGLDALASNHIQAIIQANQGGPYGSQVLKGVQADSDHVWKKMLDHSSNPGATGSTWYKATFEISGHETEPWTVAAIRPDGTKGTSYAFPPKK